MQFKIEYDPSNNHFDLYKNYKWLCFNDWRYVYSYDTAALAKEGAARLAAYKKPAKASIEVFEIN